MQTTLDDLLRRIDVVRRRERATVLLAGLARVTVLLIGIVLGYLLLDLLFQLPFYGRWIAVGLGVAALAWVVHRHLLAELRRILDDDEIALRVEARNPELRGRLISTLQLARTQSRGSYAGSLDLLKALEDDTLRVAAPLDFLKIVNRDTMRKLLAAAVLVVAVKLICLFNFPDYFSALALRLIDPQQQFPTKTKIVDMQAPEFVARGDEVKVKVRVEGEIPADAGSLTFRSEKDGLEIAIDLAPEGRNGEFTGILAKALDDMSAVARVGDGVSQPKLIRVLARPEIKDGRTLYHFPKYTGLPDPPEEKFGGLAALQGSTADLSIVATKPLAEAKLERFDGLVIPLAPVGTEGVEWKLQQPIPIEKATSFHLTLKDKAGLLNSQPAVEYPVQAKPDLPPSIKIKRPGKQDSTVVPNARTIITFEARDDFGVRTAWLVYKFLRAGEEKAEREQRVEMPVKVKAEERRAPPDLTFPWELKSLNLKPGDEIEFRLEVDDDCDSNNTALARGPARGAAGSPAPDEPGRQEAYYPCTAWYKYKVVSKEEKAQEVYAELARLFDELHNAKLTQETLKARTRDLLEALQQAEQSGAVPPGSTRQQYEELERRQKEKGLERKK